MSKIFVNKGVWGNSIRWMNFDKRSVSGHSTPVPSVGDFLDYNMKSGRTFRFKFDAIERMRDPSDMFFGNMSDVGYTDELPNVKVRGAP